MTTMTTTTPRAWIGCLGCYNAGELVGDWFAADGASDVTPGQLRSSLAEHAGHEELWVMDHEGFRGLLDGECSPAEAQELAELAAELDRNGWPVEAYAAFRDNIGRDYADVASFEDAYNGQHDSEEDFAQELADDIGAVPADLSWPVSYIDWGRATRDLFMSDYWSAPADGGGVYVFRNV